MTMPARAARRRKSPPRPKSTEIDEPKASLIGVPEASDEWFQIKTDISPLQISVA